MQRFFISKIQLKYWLGRQHLWWIPDPEREREGERERESERERERERVHMFHSGK